MSWWWPSKAADDTDTTNIEVKEPPKQSNLLDLEADFADQMTKTALEHYSLLKSHDHYRAKVRKQNGNWVVSLSAQYTYLTTEFWLHSSYLQHNVIRRDDFIAAYPRFHQALESAVTFKVPAHFEMHLPYDHGSEIDNG